MGSNKTAGVGLPGREPVNPEGSSVAVLGEAERLAGLVEDALRELTTLNQDKTVALQEFRAALDGGNQPEIAEKQARLVFLAGEIGYQTVQAAFLSKQSINFLRQHNIQTTLNDQLDVYRKLRNKITDPGLTFPGL